ncbi:MAG TPA: molybdopterin-dependent oxidoreductase, partial [Gemmatimonadaceae bacterium]|nr:molybdopterin-dependent oxidoreductase [Gemmatimonadaceae bacterium]
MSAVTAGTTVCPRLLAGESLASLAEPLPAWKKAPCRLCGVGCGLEIGIERSRAVAVRGDADSPVSKGLACAKGYHSTQALYGRDRLTKAMIRRDGSLVEAPIGEALDAVATAIRETIRKHGKDSVAAYGSAQWTIPDAYVASKLFKGGLGTNNVESSSRLYDGSAMAGLETTFGLDGSIGNYEDLDRADVFILWDINLAETDPVLFSRMLDRRRADPAVRIIDLGTRSTRTSYAADHALLHAPRSGLAIANAICHEIVAHEWTNRAFIDRHVAFRRGRTGTGYGLAGEPPVVDDAAPADWDDYVEFLESYTPDRAQELSGLPAASIRWLASVYGDPSRKVMSVWGGGASQHARGTWMNNLLYNIHLLVGKIASPGNSAFCVGSQPNGGCSVHDAGTLTHTLPRGVVQNEGDRRRAAAIWGVPVEQIDARPTHTVMGLFRALDRGDVRFLWIQATNPMATLPALATYRRAAAKDDRFVVVSDAYPTATTEVADVVLPAALWIEREGIVANAERRVQHFEQMVAPPGDAMSDAWQMIEVARRLGLSKLFPWDRRTHVAQAWEEYRRFHADGRAPLPTIAELRGRAGMIWPAANGQETKWRYNTAHDPAARRARGQFDFYGQADGRARIWLRPHEPAA